jgi:hypothetical protein
MIAGIAERMERGKPNLNWPLNLLTNEDRIQQVAYLVAIGGDSMTVVESSGEEMVETRERGNTAGRELAD